MLHLGRAIAISREGRNVIHEAHHLSQQINHSSTLVIARNRLMQLVPQSFYVVDPGAVDWLENQTKLGVVLQR